MLEDGLPRVGMNRNFLQDLSRADSRFSRGPVAANHRQHSFDPTGSSTITIPDRIENNVFFSIRWTVVVVFCPSWIKKVLTVISCNWAPGEAGNSSGSILEKTPTHSEARRTDFQHFRGERSCERIEGYLLNGLRIRLRNNWPYK